jgi:sugar phosphate isomerase/epimerase
MKEWFFWASEFQLGGIEVWVQQLESKNLNPVELKELAKKYNMKLSIHSYSWDYNLMAFAEPVRSLTINQTKKAIDLAEYLQATGITVHPGAMRNITGQENYSIKLAQTAELLAAYAKEKNTEFSLEIMEKLPQEFLTSLDAINKTESNIEGLCQWKYTLDIAHCDSKEEVFMMAHYLRNRLHEFHLSNKKGLKRHCSPASEGDFFLPEIVAALEKYNVIFALEGLDVSQNADLFKKNMEYLDNKQKGSFIYAENKKDYDDFNVLRHVRHSIHRLRQAVGAGH